MDSSTTLPTNLNNNIHITTSALDSHLTNIRSNIPPSIRSFCCPDSTSTLLNNLLLTMCALNGFFVLSSLFVIGVRFMGLSILWVSISSSIHIAYSTMIFGNHVADTISRIGLVPLANTLRNASARYNQPGRDVFNLGAMFGSTLIMAVLLHAVSSYYGGLADCVTANAAAASRGGGQHHSLSGGYDDTHNSSTAGGSSSYRVFEPYETCGSSGPVRLISFLSGMLFWLNSMLAVTLYTKRDELLSGGASGGQYEEIDPNGVGFAGDFPSSQGMRTMQV